MEDMIEQPRSRIKLRSATEGVGSLARIGCVIFMLVLLSCSDPFVSASPETDVDLGDTQPTATLEQPNQATSTTDVGTSTTGLSGSPSVPAPTTTEFASLNAGFTPDPFSALISSSTQRRAGEIADPSCVGFVGQGPSFVLDWAGASERLRIIFLAAEGRDAVIVVGTPDGRFECNDDGPEGFDPVLNILAPPTGRYQIWVGGFEAGEEISGALYITERDILPSDL